jgi:hypothetical protein
LLLVPENVMLSPKTLLLLSYIDYSEEYQAASIAVHISATASLST